MHGSRARIWIGLLGLALGLVAAGGALALQTPGRTKAYPGQVELVALNDASFAFVVGRSKHDCDHVELWNTDVKGLWRFGKPGSCTNLGSTGAGISAVGVSGNRALWVRYNGGNLRDWQLMTATTTQKTPRQLRFVEQDVELTDPPFVIGDSTAGFGIPYAAGKEVVLLGAHGAAVFKHVEPARIVAVTAGRGPAGAVVAALRETGEVDMLKEDGSLAWTVVYPPGAVKAIALAPAGLVVQLPDSVQIRKPTGSKTATLPAGAVMTDYAEGGILYTLNGTVHVMNFANGHDLLLLKSTAGKPVVATQDTHGLAWGQGTTANFACAVCVGS
jgi:hypothetical protein